MATATTRRGAAPSRCQRRLRSLPVALRRHRAGGLRLLPVRPRRPGRAGAGLLRQLVAAVGPQPVPHLGDARRRAEHRGRLRRPARPRLRRLLGDRRLRLPAGSCRRSSASGTSTSSARRRPARSAGIHINFWLVLPIGGRRLRPLGRASSAPRRCASRATTSRWSPSVSARSSPRSSATATTSAGFNLTNGAKGIDPVDPIPRDCPRDHPGCPEHARPVRQHLQVPRLRAPRRRRHLHLAAHPRGPARPGLAGHPRGRAGRQHDGRAAHADQAGGVRRRRRRRRARRRRVRHAHQRRASRTASSSPTRSRCSRWSCSAAWATSGACIVGALVLAWINSTGLPQLGALRQRQPRDRHQLPVVQLPDLRRRCWC